MPARFYGALIGTPIQTLKAGGPQAFVPRLYKDASDHVLVRDLITTAGNLTGDQISLGKLRPSVLVDSLNSVMIFDGMGANVSINIGDATYPAGLSGPTLLTTQNTLPLCKIEPAALIAAPLWQLLGYPAHPGVPIELLATFVGTGNPTSAKVFAWQIYGRNV